MNSHKNQTQELIEEINALLESNIWHSASAWKKNAQKSQTLLKRVKKFLASQSQTDSETDPTTESERPVEDRHQTHQAQMLARLVEPWQEEIENLHAHRQELVQEIRELERQRQYNYSLAQQYTKQQQIISEFSQALLAPVQDRIIHYLESIANFQQEQGSLTVPTQVSKKDEEVFTPRRVEERRQWQEEIRQQEDTYVVSGGEKNSSDRSKNRENLPSRIARFPLQGEGEIFPYPGYEWFGSGSSMDREEELEETEIEPEVLDDRSLLSEDRAESFLLSSGKVEEDEEDGELDRQELNATILQLEEEEKEEEVALEELNATILQLEEEEKADRQELSATPLQLEKEELEADVGLEKVGEEDGEKDSNEARETLIKLEETESENIEELSELFGELREKTEEKGELKNEKKTAIAKLEKEPFIPASADENLLPTKEPVEKKDLELLVNDNTIEQLATDLAQLEEANREEEDNYLEGYEWENTVLQTDGESAELEAFFPQEFLGKREEEEGEKSFVLDESSEEEEDVVSFEDFLASISDFSKQINSEDSSEEERIALEASEERTLEDILASLTSSDEDIPANDEDDEV